MFPAVMIFLNWIIYKIVRVNQGIVKISARNIYIFRTEIMNMIGKCFRILRRLLFKAWKFSAKILFHEIVRAIVVKILEALL